jgi:hypothetical protein
LTSSVWFEMHVSQKGDESAGLCGEAVADEGEDGRGGAEGDECAGGV